MFKTIWLPLLVLTIGGCSTMTAESLKSSAEKSGMVHVDLSFEQVRGNILQRAYRCWEGGLNIGSFRTEVYDLTPHAFTRVDKIFDGATSPGVFLTFEIKAGTNGGTDVRYYSSKSWIFPKPNDFTGWVTGDPNRCGYRFDSSESLTHTFPR